MLRWATDFLPSRMRRLVSWVMTSSWRWSFWRCLGRGVSGRGNLWPGFGSGGEGGGGVGSMEGGREGCEEGMDCRSSLCRVEVEKDRVPPVDVEGLVVASLFLT